MGGFGHGIQTGFQNFATAFGAKAITTLVQALEGGLHFMQAGNFALADTKIHIPLGHALGMGVARPGQGLCRHLRPRALATALLVDQPQQVSQHVFKTFKVHHGMVVLHRGNSVGHGRIMRARLSSGLDLYQNNQRMLDKARPNGGTGLRGQG